MRIRKYLLNFRQIRVGQKGLARVLMVVCLVFLTGSWALVDQGVYAHVSSDSISITNTKNSTNIEPEVFAMSSNRTSIKVENGVPKLSINGKINNNMFGIYVYCTGIDPKTNQFMIEMKEIIDRASNLDIPIMSFDIPWGDYDRSTSIPQNAEEAAGRFYTKNLDELMDYAAKKKVYLIFQLLVHDYWGLPRWWKGYKDNSNGYQLIDDASSASIGYNRLQSPVASYQSATHRELLRAFT